MYLCSALVFLIICAFHSYWIEAVKILDLIRHKPFSSIWNVPSRVCEDKYGIKINKTYFDIDANNNDRFLGDQIMLFYKDRLGLYPYIADDGTFINGGLPQLADLKKHLNQTEDDVEYYIPHENFTGLAVIDWEDWRPVYDRNNYNKHQRRFTEASEDLVRQRHPDWSNEKIKQFADMEFTIAARSFMESTLLYGRTLRPGGFWGFYGFPNCYNHEPGQSACSAETMAMNDELQWLFNTSSVLVPSIYLAKSFGTHIDRLLYVQGQLSETRRVHRKYNSKLVPILPYTEFHYRDMDELYDIEDLKNSIEQSAYAGLNGVVIWGSSRYVQTREDCVKVKEYVQTTFGPFVKNLTEFMSSCSGSLCNSHGRCVSTKWLNTHVHTKTSDNVWIYVLDLLLKQFKDYFNIKFKYEGFQCECENGWHGKFCENTSM